jgi:hypothetical protein
MFSCFELCLFCSLLGNDKKISNVGETRVKTGTHHAVRRAGYEYRACAYQWLTVAYTLFFNRRHRFSGHLFQGSSDARTTRKLLGDMLMLGPDSLSSVELESTICACGELV